MKLKKIICISSVLFVLFYLFELWQERQSKADSIGLWYTVYCALIYTIPATVAAALLVKWRTKNG